MEKKSRDYEEQKVVKDLQKKHDLDINGKQIRELRDGKGDVGIKSRGKIDFLIKYCGYVHFMVIKF